MASRCWLSVLLIAGYVLVDCTSAAVHGHAAESAERAEDGSYRARDADHFDDEGRHNVEFDHEVILGSVKEAEEFDQLSPEEAKERLAELIERMDVNNDRFIDHAELKNWVLTSFTRLSKEEADERFDEADEDKDGVVTWLEYLRDTFGADSELDIADDTGDSGMMVSEEKAMWKVADANGDGSLTPDEFLVFSNPEEHAAMHGFLVNQTMREKDSNNDGLISFQEYIGDRGSEKDREWYAAEKDRFTQDLDADSSGHLDRGEVTAWIIPNNEEIAEEEVEHLFSAADEDGDGKLSFQEILDHHHVFVGSREDSLLGEHFDDEL